MLMAASNQTLIDTTALNSQRAYDDITATTLSSYSHKTTHTFFTLYHRKKLATVITDTAFSLEHGWIVPKGSDMRMSISVNML